MSSIHAERRPGAAATATPGTALRDLAVLALVANVAIHVYLAPDHIAEIPYIGAGFVAAAMLLTGVLVGLLLWPGDRSMWLAGAVLSAGMALLFVVSRTVGLPDYHEAWTSDSGLGLWCLVPEAAFVACAIRAHSLGLTQREAESTHAEAAKLGRPSGQSG